MKRFLLMILLVGCLGAFSACGGSDATETGPVVDEAARKEGFLSSYQEILNNLELLNSYADYVGSAHSTIWDIHGVDNVGFWINAVREAKEWDEESYAVYNAFDCDSQSQAKQIAKTYNASLDGIYELIPELEALYSDLNKNYSSDYDISDLKEYYLESVSYAEFASDIEGSYVSYNQSLNDYQKSVSKLKKAAEIAY